MIPDWKLPVGVDRGLWDYLHASEMVTAYDEQMQHSPLATVDVGYCLRVFATPGRLVDLGCGTGRLCAALSTRGYVCLGVDLSEEMLTQARHNAPGTRFLQANLVDLAELSEGGFDYAACLFSTLGMVRGAENRARVVANVARLLAPGGRFVLHAHNRYFQGLGWKRVLNQRWQSLTGSNTAGDVAMVQAYGGSPLTLHHFTLPELQLLLASNGFQVQDVQAIGDDGQPATGSRIYGWLILADHNSPRRGSGL